MIKRLKKNKKYISLQEAAWIYGCTQKHMNLMARQGKLKAIKMGRNWFTTFKWLNEYIELTERKKKKKFFVLSFKNSFIILIVFLFLIVIATFIFLRSQNQELSIATKFFNYTNRKIASVSGFANDVFSSRKEFFFRFSQNIKEFFIIESLVPYYPSSEMTGQSYNLIKNIHRRLNNIEKIIEEEQLKTEEVQLKP